MHKSKIDSLIGKRIRAEKQIKLPSGRHTTPKVYSIGRRKFVLKTSSKGRGLTLAQARELAEGVKEYNSLLKSAGVRVSEVEIARAMPEKLGSNNYYVSSLERFINRRNISEIIATSSPKKAVLVFRQLAEEIHKTITTNQISRNKSGILIDSKPKNYVVGRDGKIYYIDFYTPKLLDKSGKLCPYFKQLHSRSREELQTRFQDKRALFQILLAHTVAQRPKLRRLFEKELLDLLNQKGETRLVSYLEGVIKRDYRVTKLVKESDLEPIKKELN